MKRELCNLEADFRAHKEYCNRMHNDVLVVVFSGLAFVLGMIMWTNYRMQTCN